MGIYPIRSEADHARALARIEVLMDKPALTADEGYELDALVTLVEAYEQKHLPVREATPVAMIEFMLDQQGLTRKDLEPMIGSRARVSEVLSGKRSLTLAMIRRLSEGLCIPADLLIGTEAGRTTAAQTKRRARETSLAKRRNSVAA
jgi:HTH-type transcriptional regulator / antitoxin HigA